MSTIDLTGRELTINVTNHQGCALFTATDGGSFYATHLTFPSEGTKPTEQAVQSIVSILLGMARHHWAKTP